MEKEIYWSKDVDASEGNLDSKIKTAKNAPYGSSQSNKSSDAFHAANWRSTSNSRMKTSSPVNVLDSKGLTHLNNLTSTSLPLQTKTRLDSKFAEAIPNSQASSNRAIKNVPKEKPACGVKLNDLTNVDASKQSGASFKSLRNEDKLKLASLIQELATLTEEHSLLKSSLEERVQLQQLERAAFEQETKKLYQEREFLSQTKLELEQKLHETLDELESVRSRETSRASVCLQTTPPKDKQQTNAPTLNISFCSENSQGSRKSSTNPDSRVTSNKENQDNPLNDEGKKLAGNEPKTAAKNSENTAVTRPLNFPSDAGLQNVEVFSKTEDCFSHCGSMLVGETNPLSTIEKETLALKKKIAEQEKLLELKRKQIDLQHQLHNQEIDAYNFSKKASEENVKNWIENLPTGVDQYLSWNEKDMHGNYKPGSHPSGPKVTFSDVKNSNSRGETFEEPLRSAISEVARAQNVSQDVSSSGKLRPRVKPKFMPMEKDPEYASSSSEDERILRLKHETQKMLLKKTSSGSHDNRKPISSNKGERTISAKVDSYYRPVKKELELKPYETTDDLLLEAAGKLMHCRRMMDRSENAINQYQYTKYMEALEQKKLNEKLPVDDEFQRNMRRSVANDNGRKLMQASGVEQSDKATEFIPSFVKLIDYMDDKVESPKKYSTAAADNVVNFALGYSPDDIFSSKVSGNHG